jgi:hypothetical protein
MYSVKATTINKGNFLIFEGVIMRLELRALGLLGKHYITTQLE